MIVDPRRSSDRSGLKHNLLIAGFLFAAVAIAYVLYYEATRKPRYVGGPVAIVQGDPPRHGMLGVSFSGPLTELRLGDVLVDGPAFQAGLQAEDEIIAIDEKGIDTIEQLYARIESTQPGDQIVIRVSRSGTEMDLAVRLCDFDSILAIRGPDGFGQWRALPGPRL